MKITEVSFDGEYWFKADENGGCVIRTDDINPMESVKVPRMLTREF